MIAKHFDSPIERIDHIDCILLIDKQPGGKSKVSRRIAALPEVIKKVAFPIEDLHHAPETIDYINVTFAVKSDSLGPEHGCTAVAWITDCISKRAVRIQTL